MQTTVPAELVLMVEQLKEAPITASQLATWTRRDPLMARVLRYIQQGWPQASDEDLKAYWPRRMELSCESGCVVWGGRVVVPPQGRESVLAELHSGHPGISRMKSLARGLVWWPGIDGNIETLVKSCSSCQQNQPSPPTAPMQPWSWPTRPWSRLHVDYAGPMDGKMFLVVIDAHSKWIEVSPVSTATALTTIQQLRKIFAQFGIPDTIVSDNGTQFTASEFKEFCRLNGIRHTCVAPYHPSSNGLAERAVKIFKEGFKKQAEGSLSDRIARMLFQYRITPHTTTGVAPAELLMGRKLKSRLDILRPQVESRVQDRQSRQKADHDKSSRVRQFSVGESVFVKNHGRGDRWLLGQITEVSGPLSFKVKVQDGRVIRSHQDHLRKREEVPRLGANVPESNEEDDALGPTLTNPEQDEEQPEHPAYVADEGSNTLPATHESSPAPTTLNNSSMEMTSSTNEDISPPAAGRVYPARTRNQPDWYHNHM